MTYLALARKWRPLKFSDVVGQDHVVTALSNALDSKRVHHAYLFTGTRGVGKTTLARIFAKSLNCEVGVSAEPCQQCSVCVSVDQGNYVDLLEVDAASRTGIDDMRELLDNVQYAPTSGSYKVYLIDEVHMLSKSSFNALLKTLEEPPEHVKFLFATTDPQKLPVTVLSRCLQFSLLALQPSQISAQINKILTSEGIRFEAGAIDMISRAASGSMRDSLSLLEQAIAQGAGSVNEVIVQEMLGAVKAQYIDGLLDKIANNDAFEALRCTEEMASYAVDFSTAIDQLLMELHHISLAQIAPKTLAAKQLDEEKYVTLAKRFSAEQIQLLYQIALIGKRDLALAPDPRSGFEMVLMRMMAFSPEQTGESLNLGGTNVTATAVAAASTTASTAAPSLNKEPSSLNKEPSSLNKEPSSTAVTTEEISIKTTVLSPSVQKANQEQSPESVQQPSVISMPSVTPEADLPPADSLAPKPSPANPVEMSDIKDVSPGRMEPQMGNGHQTTPDIKVEPRDLRQSPSGKTYASSPLVQKNDEGNQTGRVEPVVAPAQPQTAQQTEHQSQQPSIKPSIEPLIESSVKQQPVPSQTQPSGMPSQPVQQQAPENVSVESQHAPNYQQAPAQATNHNQTATSQPTTSNIGVEADDELHDIKVDPASKATWAGLVEGLHLNGLVKEFAMNIACDDITANPMVLYFDPGYKFLHNPPREESVFNEIRKARGGDFEIKLIMEKSVSETPSERLRRKQVEKRDLTKDVMLQDQGVQGLMDAFDLSMNEQSIKPK